METEKERNSFKYWGMSILTLMLMMLPAFAIEKCQSNNTKWEYTDCTFHFQGYSYHYNYHNLDLPYSEIASVVIYDGDKKGIMMKITKNDGTTLNLDCCESSTEILYEHINNMCNHLKDLQNAPTVQDLQHHTITIHNDKPLIGTSYFDLTVYVNNKKICVTEDKKLTLNVKTGDIVTMLHGRGIGTRAFIFRFQDPSITHYYIDNLTIECMSEEE